jgi:hypothetical protein
LTESLKQKSFISMWLQQLSMTNKVYIVEGYTPYEGRETIKIFSSEEDAKECAKQMKDSIGRLWEDYFVEEYDVY